MSRSKSIGIAVLILAAGCVGVLAVWLMRDQSTPAARNVSASTGDSSSTSLVGNEAEVYLASHFPSQRVLRLSTEQLDALKRDSAAILAAYTAGSFTATRSQLLNIRQELPPSWKNSFDMDAADKELEWFYSSLAFTKGDMQVLNLSTGEPHVTSPEYVSLTQGRNASIGVHKEGLAVLTEGTSVPVYEVQAPVTYVFADGVVQPASLAVRLAWSKTQRKWVQIGAGLYGFPVDRPIPMMPY